MSVNTQFIEAQGAYAIPRKEGKTILIRVPDEDLGKVEGGADWPHLFPVVQGMFGIVTGGVEQGETYPETLSRELEEEQSVVKPPEFFTNGLPTAQIKQIRPSIGKQVLFTVSGHQFPLSDQEVSILQKRTELLEIADSQLITFLKESSAILRPSVHAILTLFYEYLERGEKIL